MILYFIIPTGFVKIESKAVKFIPVTGPALEYTKKAKKITEISDPVTASSRGIGVMFNYCFGKAGAMTTECILWLALSGIGGVTGNPVLIGAGVQFGNMVLDELID